MAKAAKIQEQVVIGFYRARFDKNRFKKGTLAQLVEYYQGTLECGKAYEHERGNRKISLNPRNLESLVKNLNNACDNKAANGYCEDYYFIPTAEQLEGAEISAC